MFPHMPLRCKLSSSLLWVHWHPKIFTPQGCDTCCFLCLNTLALSLHLTFGRLGLNVISMEKPSTKSPLLKISLLMIFLIGPCSLPSCFPILYLLRCLLVYCLLFSVDRKLPKARNRFHSRCSYLQLPRIQTSS